MWNTYDISLYLYNFTLVPVVFFSVLYLLLTLINIFLVAEKKQRFPNLKEMPFISVQIPSYNDPIAERCIRKCMEFDYPKDKFEIVIVDDSTNAETQMLLRSISDENESFVKYIHRTNRQGFKAGALNNAMKITKGEVIVIFDSDWIPAKDFLKKIITPFSDPKVAIVQARQGFYNHDANLMTRFAAYTMMIHHMIILPINNRINCVFFCGTAGAIRRSCYDEVGGWKLNSLAEDSDISVKLLIKGYKSVYLEHETPSEVPDTFESLVRQQMRWAYGNTRVFLDQWKNIFFSPSLTISQRLMITYVTLGNFATPFVIAMAFFGLLGWFTGDPKLFEIADLVNLIFKFLLCSGFFIIGYIALKKRNMLKDFWKMVITTMLIGPIIATGNSIGFIKAATNTHFNWYCTPKAENEAKLKAE